MSLPQTESSHILTIAIIQAQDEKKAVMAFQEAGYDVETIAASGGFLARKNTTLLIPILANQIPSVIKIIQQNCHQRTEYITTPLEGAPLPIPISTPITIGGAYVFFLPIDFYEEI